MEKDVKEKEIKKENKKVKKILRIVLLIIAILIVIVLANAIRNYVIITNLQNKISQYSDSTNYHMKSVANEGNGTIVTMEYYRKDNREVVFLERNINGEKSNIAMYNNGERTDIFTVTTDSKIAQLDSGTILSVNIYNQLETENNWQTFIESLFVKIRKTNCNDRECYEINGSASSMPLISEGEKIFVDKNTGLLTKTVMNDIVSEREYEFNNVQDSIFVEPDISQYTLKGKD